MGYNEHIAYSYIRCYITAGLSTLICAEGSTNNYTVLSIFYSEKNRRKACLYVFDIKYICEQRSKNAEVSYVNPGSILEYTISILAVHI